MSSRFRPISTFRGNHNHTTMVTTYEERARCRHWAIGLVVVFVGLVILCSIYQDTKVATEMYVRSSLAQTQLDTRLQHLIPKIPPGGIPPPSEILGPNVNVSTVIEPSMGSHKYDRDAVFAIGDGLELKDYVLFVRSLRNTGFDGDIVLSTWPREEMPEGVFDFLNYESQAGLVVYEGAIRADSQEQTIHHDEVNSTKVWLHGLYGIPSADNNNFDVIIDPRVARSLGVARFELFWVWSKKYSSKSRILLIDAKDTYFQPFAESGIGIGRYCQDNSQSILHLYEENKNKIKLATIPDRAKLKDAYNGKSIMLFIHNENVLTPASTHGSQKAIEAYLRAMVQQYDDTRCGKYQCEWAFHNYIYYFGVLSKMDEIDYIERHMQGLGAINSIGLDAPLNNVTSLFDNQTSFVLNRALGNGIFNSWAVHQYDRDPDLHYTMDGIAEILTGNLNYNEPLSQDAVYFKDFEKHVLKAETKIITEPYMGKHRPGEHAVFSIVSGSFAELALFLLSARKSGFEGDIVLQTPKKTELDAKVIDFLKYQSERGVVWYEGEDIQIKEGQYDYKLKKAGIFSDLAIYETFLIWSTQYSEVSYIMIIDGESSYFQTNPFVNITGDCDTLNMHFYMEHYISKNFRFLEIDDNEMWLAMLKIFGMSEGEFFEKYEDNFLLIPTAMVGQQVVLGKYLKSIANLLKETKCYQRGCDWAAINYIWYEEVLEVGSPISVHITAHDQGQHLINSNVATSLSFLENKDLFKSDMFMNWDGIISPVVLNFDSQVALRDLFKKRLQSLLQELNN